jgi:hypothetical protein
MEEYYIIEWPESQDLMDEVGFEDNCFLLDVGSMFGSAAYAVNKNWYLNLKKK